MINKLTIEQFQAYEYSEFEFCDGVNVIVGSSDRGKTSVLRALRWLIFNRAPGDFVSHWLPKGASTRVKAELNNNLTVSRELTGKINAYVLSDLDEPLTAFGKQVPEMVEDVFNMSELNYQSQHDPPFLFSSSSGEVARTLNEAVNLSKIDSSLKWVGKQKRAAWTDLEHARKEHDTTQAAIDDLPDLEPVESEMAALRAIVSKQQETEAQAKQLQDLIEQLAFERGRRDQLIDPGPAKAMLLKLKQTAEQLNQKSREHTELKRLVTEYRKDQLFLKSLPTLDGVKEQLSCAKAKQMEWTATEKQVQELTRLIQEETMLVSRIAVLKEEQKADKAEYKEHMAGKCPLCGQEIKDA